MLCPLSHIYVTCSFYTVLPCPCSHVFIHLLHICSAVSPVRSMLWGPPMRPQGPVAGQLGPLAGQKSPTWSQGQAVRPRGPVRPIQALPLSDKGAPCRQGGPLAGQEAPDGPTARSKGPMSYHRGPLAGHKAWLLRQGDLPSGHVRPPVRPRELPGRLGAPWLAIMAPC